MSTLPVIEGGPDDGSRADPTLDAGRVDGAAAGTRRRVRRPGLLRQPSTVLGLALVALFVLCAVLAPVVAPRDPSFQDPAALNALGEPLPPGSAGLPLGSDVVGRDVLSRLIHGARVAVFIAIVPNLLALLLATTVGLLAGYLRGWVETVLMRFTEMLMTLPAFLLALALLAVLGPGLWPVVLALVLVTWTYPARVIYGEVLRIQALPFVDAARAIGATSPRIMLRHVLPQLFPLLATYFTLNAAFMVLVEAGLGFLGFGIQPPTPSWGAMIGAGREYLFWPWLIMLPGLCLALLSIGFYLLGDAIQRRLAPAARTVRLS